EAIEQAFNDTSKPSAEQSLIDSGIPGVLKNSAISALTEAFQNGASNDPTGGGNHSDPLSDLSAAIAAARGKLDNMDLINASYPTQKGGLHDDWIRGAPPSLEQLRAQLGLGGGGQDGSTGASGSAGSGSTGSGSSGVGTGQL